MVPDSLQPTSAPASLLPLLDESHRSALMPCEEADYARRLYATLRSLDQQHGQTIWIQMPPACPEWAAVRDRLTRATRGG